MSEYRMRELIKEVLSEAFEVGSISAFHGMGTSGGKLDLDTPQDDYEANFGKLTGEKARLFTTLKHYLGNENLSLAMVANAVAESSMDPTAKGDGGAYADERSDKSIEVDGERYCSFGYWQYNICAGLGIDYLKALVFPYVDMSDASDEDKLIKLESGPAQIAFMIRHVKEKAGSDYQDEKTINYWVEWFVREIEKPANIDEKVVERQKIAYDLVGVESSPAVSDTTDSGADAEDA